MITSWLFSIYNWFRRTAILRSTSFIVFVGVFLLIGSEYLFQFSWRVSSAISYSVYWMLIALTFAALMLAPWRAKPTNTDRLIVQAFMTGLVIGSFIAIYKAFVYFELWTLFNLLAEPLRTALFGILVVWVIAQQQKQISI